MIGRLHIAPVGSDVRDATRWREVGAVVDAGLTLSRESVCCLANLPAFEPQGFNTFTLSVTWARPTWKGHRLFFQETHPAARRAKTLYRRRTRRRTRP